MIFRVKHIRQLFQLRFKRYTATCSKVDNSNKMVDTNTCIAGMRIDYTHDKQLDTENLPTKDPISLFQIWFTEAKDCEKIEEPNAMTLATSTRYRRTGISK